jgi:hypothetical protein
MKHDHPPHWKNPHPPRYMYMYIRAKYGQNPCSICEDMRKKKHFEPYLKSCNYAHTEDPATKYILHNFRPKGIPMPSFK